MDADLDKALTELDRSINKLKLDYERFFAGVEKIAPERERDRVAAIIRQLNATTMQNSGQRFYYQTLMARFYSYVELWNRLTRVKEEGIAAAAALALVHKTAPPPFAPKTTRGPPPADFSRCVLKSGQENDRIEGLFGQFIEMRKQTGEPVDKLSRQSFQKLIQGQYQQIVGKSGVEQVEFRLTVKDGKVQMTAKPVAAR